MPRTSRWSVGGSSRGSGRGFVVKVDLRDGGALGTTAPASFTSRGRFGTDHRHPQRGDVSACPSQRLDRRPLRQHPGRRARRSRPARRWPDRSARPWGTSLVALAIALALLGVGWNIGLLSGTTALAGALDPATRARTQGRVDVAVALGGAAGGFGSGSWSPP